MGESTSSNSVVITGMGIVSPLGCDAKVFWQGLQEGRSGVERISSFDSSGYPCQIAACVRDFHPEDIFDKKELRHYDAFVQYALVAAHQAVEHAALDLAGVDPQRVGVFVGSGLGGLETLERNHRALLEKGPRRVSPYFMPMTITNMAAGLISIHLGVQGPNLSVSTACATANHAFGLALNALRRGDADIILAGGSEAIITPLGLASFCAAKAVATSFNDAPQRASRPFDARREGFVMGEGAGVLVLERGEHAVGRQATVLAELAGVGMSSDAYHITAPEPGGRGAAQAMRQALHDADLPPDAVDYVNAHGTSTRLNDRIETAAIKRVFGDHAGRLAISSTKSMTGHALGAAPAIELIATVLALQHQVLPPTINQEDADPDCDLDYVANAARPSAARVAMSNAFGFGGQNASIVVRRGAATP